MFQHSNVFLAGWQAASAGIPWHLITTDGRKKNEMDDLERALKEIFKGTIKPTRGPKPSAHAKKGVSGFDALVCGALASDYQKRKIDLLCDRLGILSYAPLWHNNPLSHLQHLCEAKIVARVTRSATEGLGPEWIGRVLDQDAISELVGISDAFRFRPDGEGGEYETCVTDAPFMRWPLDVRGRTIRNDGGWEWKVDQVSLQT